MGFKSFNIRDMAVSLNAVPLDGGGYPEDEFMSVEWGDEWWKKYVGSDSEVTRVPTNDFSARVTLRYQMTADANDRLMAILKADVLLPNGAGAGVFMARDLNGRLVVTGPRAWVVGPASPKVGKTVQVNEWMIDIADASASFIGGR